MQSRAPLKPSPAGSGLKNGEACARGEGVDSSGTEGAEAEGCIMGAPCGTGGCCGGSAICSRSAVSASGLGTGSLLVTSHTSIGSESLVSTALH